MPGVYASESEIIRIGEKFADCSLPRSEWTHAAHFAAALWLLRTRPELDAPAAMPGMIRAYNESVGRVNDQTGGYHETITLASLRALKGVLDANLPETPLFEIVNALMASSLGNPNWLLDYWSQGRLMSVEARLGWLEPDKKPLPF